MHNCKVLFPAIFLHGLEKDMHGAESTNGGVCRLLGLLRSVLLSLQSKLKNLNFQPHLKIRKIWQQWASITTLQQLTVLCRCDRNTPGCRSFLCLPASPQIHPACFINLRSLPGFWLLQTFEIVTSGIERQDAIRLRAKEAKISGLLS